MEGKPGYTHKPSSLPEFSRLTNLASEDLGGEIVACSDDFFASADNLIKDAEAIWDSELMSDRGKWMDGWETKRHNKQDFDWVIIKLGLKGFVDGVLVDTSHFSGNHAPSISVEAASVEDRPISDSELIESSSLWQEMISKNSCYGCCWNFFQVEKEKKEPVSHIRLKIYPDGGVARLRVFGRVAPSFSKNIRSNETIDLVGIQNGGIVVSASDSHFSSKDNIIKPWRSKSMKDGWETKRSRIREHTEWIIFQLGHTGYLKHLEIDTRHFKGNYPDFCEVYGCLSSEKPGDKHLIDIPPNSDLWIALTEKVPLGPHRRHFLDNLKKEGPFSHLKIVIYPDGGIARFRAFGTLRDPKLSTNSFGSLLCEASAIGDKESLQILLNDKIPVDCCNCDKRTALHIAAAENHIEIVKLLLEYGADKKVKDRWGKTPHDDAIQSNHEDIAKLLE